MKRMILCGLLVALFLSLGSALRAAENDIKEFPVCKFCGMNRQIFAYSRMWIEYDDGTKEGVCSLHCAAIDLALKLEKEPRAIWVGDYNRKTLIDAETAVWVIGGSKPGVMTKNAKWAFADKADAERYRQEFGGRIAGFDEALDATYRDLDEDTRMIRELRMKRKMKMMELKK